MRRAVIKTDEHGGISMWLWVRFLGFIWLPDATLWVAKGYDHEIEQQLADWKWQYGERLQVVDKRSRQIMQ
jgi:hypothetical protein